MSSDRLWDMIVSQAGSSRSSLHCWVGDHFDTTPWPDVVRDAEMMTGGLRHHGIRPGTRLEEST